jgi:cobalamin biosynthesis protein CbiD
LYILPCQQQQQQQGQTTWTAAAAAAAATNTLQAEQPLLHCKILLYGALAQGLAVYQPISSSASHMLKLSGTQG